MSNHNLIIRDSVKQHYNKTTIKRRVFNNSTVNRNPKCQKIIHGFALPQIAIKVEDNCQAKNKVVLVNGCWDTSNPVPNIVAEMHNMPTSNDNFTNGTLSEVRDLFNPSPRGSDSGIESDCTDGNLSWLLNYKIHELPPVPDSFSLDNGYYNQMTANSDMIIRNSYNEIPGDISSRLIKTGKEEEKNQNHRYSGPKKPPFTYTELIEHALSEKGELTVSGIYQWISEHFPFYKQNDDRWKNSVRHNLSINPHFRKGGKAVQGAGHLWTIAQKDDKKAWQIKQRMQQFIQTSRESDQQKRSQEAFDMELEAATASILDEFEQNSEGPKKQNIEVEFINVIDVNNGLEDFLSPPVSKQQLVQECGLGNDDFLITDLNPNALGLNLVDGEVINDGNFYEDISFEYYELEKE